MLRLLPLLFLAACSKPSVAAKVKLLPVVSALDQPTDVQSVPGQGDLLVVAEKTGRAVWVDPQSKKSGTWLKVTPLTRSEQGLLGIAFHPQFAKNGRFFLHYSAKSAGKAVGRIEAWRHPGGDPRKGQASAEYVLLEVEQPYANHDGGQIAFGPDANLYIGLGDGGAADDPHGHGQNLETLLGAILRVNVDGKRPYEVPKDNPLRGKAGRDEIFAWGLRNPWRFSFAPDGRLVVGDVGQNRLEEITFAPKGANLGWKIREANRCFAPRTGCKTAGLTDPIFQYGRDLGVSVSGGVVAGAKAPVVVRGKYVFGDFGSGRLWALDLPPKGSNGPASAQDLGTYGIQPTAFGSDASGQLYVCDFKGRLMRVDGL